MTFFVLLPMVLKKENTLENAVTQSRNLDYCLAICCEACLCCETMVITTSNSSGFLICKEMRLNDLKTLDSFLKCYDPTDTSSLIFVDLKKKERKYNLF